MSRPGRQFHHAGAAELTSGAEGEAGSANALPFAALAPLVQGPTAARNPELIARLAAASARRAAADPGFAAVQQANARRADLRAEKTIPLERSACTAAGAAGKEVVIDAEPDKEPPHYRSEVCKLAHG